MTKPANGGLVLLKDSKEVLKMKKLCTILSAVILLFAVLPANSADLLGAEKKMQNVDYWLKNIKNADEQIMTRRQIKKINAGIREAKGTYCLRLLEYPDAVSGERVKGIISPEKHLCKNNYVNGLPVTNEFMDALIEESNLAAVQDTVEVRYAFAADNTVVRAEPTHIGSFSSPDDELFDRYVVSLIKIWEPLLVLHTSKSGVWSYIIAANCNGWVRTEDLTFTDKKNFKKYSKKPFLLVTGAKIYPRSGLKGKRWEFQMGTRLPLAKKHNTIVESVGSYSSYVVLLPAKDQNGNLVEKELLIPRSADVHVGFLPYTQKNIIKSAFKLLGEPYGWGSSFVQWDCSGLVHDVYSLFGFELPRNSGAQVRIPAEFYDAKIMNDEEKTELLAQLPAGTMIQMPGHIMLYLGTVNGKPYVLHDTYSAHKHEEETEDGALGKEILINCVVVSDMELRRANGKKIITCIEKIVAVR